MEHQHPVELQGVKELCESGSKDGHHDVGVDDGGAPASEKGNNDTQIPGCCGGKTRVEEGREGEGRREGRRGEDGRGKDIYMCTFSTYYSAECSGRIF